jgi:hypothetical protein
MKTIAVAAIAALASALAMGNAPAEPAPFNKLGLEANGVKLDEPAPKSPATGNIVTYITNAWGTRIEIIERAPLQPTQ